MDIDELKNRYYAFNGKFKSIKPSPVNTLEFYGIFTDILCYLAEENDPNTLTFDGEGAYGGRQFSITVEPNMIDAIQLEVVLHNDGTIVVYSGRHNGFSVASFISREDAHLIARAKEVFRKVMGL